MVQPYYSEYGVPLLLQLNYILLCYHILFSLYQFIGTWDVATLAIVNNSACFLDFTVVFDILYYDVLWSYVFLVRLCSSVWMAFIHLLND